MLGSWSPKQWWNPHRSRSHWPQVGRNHLGRMIRVAVFLDGSGVVWVVRWMGVVVGLFVGHCRRGWQGGGVVVVIVIVLGPAVVG